MSSPSSDSFEQCIRDGEKLRRGVNRVQEEFERSDQAQILEEHSVADDCGLHFNPATAISRNGDSPRPARVFRYSPQNLSGALGRSALLS